MPYLWDLPNSFSKSFIDFYSCEVVSWSDVYQSIKLRPLRIRIRFVRRLFFNFKFTSCKWLRNVYILWCLTWNRTKNINKLSRVRSTDWKLSLTHLLYHCPLSIAFWRDFEAYWSVVRDEQIHLTLENIIVGVITRPCPLLNYFLLIAKIYLWDCRRNQAFLNIVGFRAKIELKYETEAYTARKGNEIKFLQSKWANCSL